MWSLLLSWSGSVIWWPHFNPVRWIFWHVGAELLEAPEVTSVTDGALPYSERDPRTGPPKLVPKLVPLQNMGPVRARPRMTVSLKRPQNGAPEIGLKTSPFETSLFRGVIPAAPLDLKESAKTAIWELRRKELTPEKYWHQKSAGTRKILTPEKRWHQQMLTPEVLTKENASMEYFCWGGTGCKWSSNTGNSLTLEGVWHQNSVDTRSSEKCCL